MNENITEITIRFIDEEERDIKQLFNVLQKLKAKEYLELYQLMYQDLIEHQQLNYFEVLKESGE